MNNINTPIFLSTKGPRFVITGLPRSGTTWMANFYTTDNVICLHDPIGAAFTPIELVNYDPGYPFGISCTSAWMFPGFLEQCVLQGARIMIIDRPINEVNNSLLELSFDPMPPETQSMFAGVPGPRVPFKSIFDSVEQRKIWNWLRPDIIFPKEKFEQFKSYHVEPVFAHVKQDTSKYIELLGEIRKITHNLAN